MMRSSRVLALTPELQLLPTRGPRLFSPRCFSSSSASLQAVRKSARGTLPSSRAAFFLSNRAFERSNCLNSVISRRNWAAASASAPALAPAPAPAPASAPGSSSASSSSSPQSSSPYSATSSSSSSSTSTLTSTLTSTSIPNSTLSPERQSIVDLPPHRQRRARKQAGAAGATSTTDAPLPPDASSALTSAAAAQPTSSLRRTISIFLSLSKPRLTVLVVLTAMVPYALYPVPEMLTPSMTETPSLSPLTLLFLTTGTALCSASANALNMLYEPGTDSKMTRTRNRPLVRGLVSTRAAALFAVLAGAAGVAALYLGVNPTVSFLGLSNVVLYAGIYTPLKAVTALNTWVGAVVGGIPPLMGWAAAAGEAATRDGSWRELLLASDGSSFGGWLLAGLLFAWQFPHFMALSWPIREEYKAAGLRMLAWTNPRRNARVALRYSLVFVPLCAALCAAGVTDWSFAATSLPINLWLVREALRFWKYEGHRGSARGLFWASVWHLPGVLILALIHKKGMWTRAWQSVFGADDAGEWEEAELDDLDEMASMAAANTVAQGAQTTPRR